jgi:hypothetical protein
MREIGRLFGITSHKVGKKLKKVGLRTPQGRPSQRAFEEGYVQQRWGFERQEIYNWTWHKDKTIALLEEAGFERVEDVDELS